MSGDTRLEILQSALDLFAEKNYHAVSMTEIAEGAGVSKGTLYWYYDSKQELFQKIVIEGIDYFHKQFQRITAEKKDFKTTMCRLVEFVFQTLSQHLSILNVFRNNSELINEDFKDKVEKKHHKNIEIVAEVMKRGIEEGLVKEVDPYDLAALVLSVLFTPQLRQTLGEKEKVKKRVDFIYDFIMNGISRKEQKDEKQN